MTNVGVRRRLQTDRRESNGEGKSGLEQQIKDEKRATQRAEDLEDVDP